MYLCVHTYINIGICLYLHKCISSLYLLNVFCLHVCMFVMCLSGAHGGQKRALNPLQLELQTVLNHMHV